MLKILLGMTAAAILAASPALAFDAAESCRETGVMLTTLSDDYAEQVIFAGRKGESSQVVSLHLSPSGSWSIVVSGDGYSCLAAFGDSGQINN